MSRPLTLFPSVLAAVGLVFAACSAPAPVSTPTDAVTITFENYNLAAAGPGRDATIAMLDDFHRLHPNITVEQKATVDQTMFSSVQAEVVAGNPPDLAQLLLREWDQNVENLPIKTLSDIVPADELQSHLGGQYPIHPKAVALTMRDNKLQGLPYVFSTPTLFYNASLFSAAGLDPNTAPRTWDEVRLDALAIKQKTGNGGLYIACIELDWCTQAVVLSNGGRVLSDDRKELHWAEPNSVQVYSFWQSMVRDGAHANLSGADAQAAFQGGTLGMLLNTSAVQGSILKSAEGKFEVKAAGMPAFGDKLPVPTNSGSGLAILATTPARQRAAWELMKYLTSEHAFTVITSEIGYLPLRTGIINDPAYLNAWLGQHPQILPNIQQMDNLAPSLSYPGQNALQIRRLYLDTLAQVLYQGAEPGKAFGDAETRAQSLMPRP